MIKKYLYAIADFGAWEGTVTGIDGAPLYPIPYKGVQAVVSDFIDHTHRVTQNHIIEHERAVEKLMESFTVLPARFFTIFDSDKSITATLKEHYKTIKENLERVKGKVEFGLKIIRGSSHIRDSFAGTLAWDSNINSEYAKTAKDRHIESIESKLFEISVEKRTEESNTETLLLSAAYLVEKEKMHLFRQTVEKLKGSFPELRFLSSGPWPPYNFINLP
jgi:hypothetical protein